MMEPEGVFASITVRAGHPVLIWECLMAEIIHLHKAAQGRRKERTFIPTGRNATVLFFTGVRYERDKPEKPVGKESQRRRKGR